VSDLNRSTIKPHARIELSGNVSGEFSEIRASDVSAQVFNHKPDTVTRINHRLNRIQTEFLPILGVQCSDATSVEQWLKDNGYGSLWSPWSPELSLRKIRKWYSDAYWIAHSYPRKGWTSLSVSSSLLETGWIYWDIVDGRQKYGSR
jgi:hypothetical protein